MLLFLQQLLQQASSTSNQSSFNSIQRLGGEFILWDVKATVLIRSSPNEWILNFHAADLVTHCSTPILSRCESTSTAKPGHISCCCSCSPEFMQPDRHKRPVLQQCSPGSSGQFRLVYHQHVMIEVSTMSMHTQCWTPKSFDSVAYHGLVTCLWLVMMN